MSFERLSARARELGEARAEAVRARVVEVIAQEVPGARVELSARDVVVSGRGLSVALRWIGSLLR